jgi:predicted RNase H-like nuclease (RuvC/YqgF family)
MKKVKSLKKKIRRLEARLQKGEKKLARLKQKLGAAETRAAAKSKGKSTGVTQKASKASASIDKSKKRLPLKTGAKPAASVKGPAAAKSAKRKLNLTPERREQLAAAMRARWAAKRAAAGMNTQQSSGPASGDASQPQ